MGIAETLQIDEMVQDFKRMNKRQVSFGKESSNQKCRTQTRTR